MSLSETVRADNWWRSKIPPLLSVAYAQILFGQLDPLAALAGLAVTLISLVGVASYGHVINDIFDIEADRLAGKPNRMAGVPIPRQFLITLALLGLTYLPLVWLGAGGLSFLLVTINLLLPTVYSIPPLRLKERGILGVLCDSSGAHAVPTLFMLSVFAGLSKTDEPLSIPFAVAVTFWAFAVGLKGILNHMIADREKDILAGVVTFGVREDPFQTLRQLSRVVYCVELPAFLVVLWLLAPVAPALVPLFVLYCAVELAKGWAGWKAWFEAGTRFAKANLPLANNYFYELWLPLTLSATAAVRQPGLAWLPAAQLLLFWRNAVEQVTELPSVGRGVMRQARNLVWERRLGFRLELQGIARARLVSRDKAVRVAIDRAADHPWFINVLGPRQTVQAGQRYRLHFRARADRIRRATVGVFQDAEPRQPIGRNLDIELTPEWQSFITALVSDHDERVVPCFWLGRDGASVELAEVALALVPGGIGWDLLCHENCLAQRLARDSAQPMAARFSLPKVDGVPWHVKASWGPLSIRAGATYRLEFRARADAARPVGIGVAEFAPPWRPLGLAEDIELTPQWRTYREELVATETETAAIYFWLGANDTPADIEDVRLEELPSESLWHLDRIDERRATRLAVEGSDEGIRVEPLTADGPADRLKLWHGGLQIVAGRTYRLEWSARADQPRIVTVGIGQSARPWDDLGLRADIFLAAAPVAGFADFVATAEERDACVYFLVAGDATPVEILSARLSPRVEDAAPWLMECRLGRVAQRLPAPAGRAKVEVIRPGDTADGIRMTRGGFSVDEGRWYQAKIAARSPVARRIAWTLCQEHPPWKELGLFEQLEIGPDERTFVAYFPAKESESKAALSLWLGADSGEVHWTEPTLTSLPAPRWQLACATGCIAYRIARENAEPVIIARTDGVPWNVTMATPTPPVVAGEWYRLTICLRADKPRPVTVGLARPNGAAGELGLLATLWPANEWRDFVECFPATGDEQDPRLVLWLGSATGNVECAAFDLEPVPPAERFLLTRLEQCQAVARPVESGAIRIDSIATSGIADHLKVVWPDVSLEAGRGYSLVLSCRAERPRTVEIGVGQSAPPLDDLGLAQQIPLTNEWRQLCFEFTATATDRAARIYMRLGQDTSAVEWRFPRLVPLGRVPWLLETAGGALARRIDTAQSTSSASDDRIGAARPVRIEIESTTGTSENVKLSRLGPAVQPNHWYRAVLRARAESPRSVAIGLCQSRDPWANLGLAATIAVGMGWQTFWVDFFATVAEADATLFAHLGDRAGWIEIAELEVVSGVGEGPWLLEVAAPAVATRLAGERGPVIRTEATDGVAERVQLRRPGIQVEQGTWYSVRLVAHASEPTVLTIGLIESAPPWSTLGLWETVSVDALGISLQWDFSASQSASNAVLVLWLGARACRIEIAECSLREGDRLAGWRIEAGDGGRAHRVPADESMRIAIDEPGTEGWCLKLVGPTLKVRKEAPYLLTFRVRAERPRRISVGVAQAGEPWENLGLYAELSVTSSWATIRQEWWGRIDGEGRLEFSFGGDAAGIELAEVEHIELPPPPPPPPPLPEWTRNWEYSAAESEPPNFDDGDRESVRLNLPDGDPATPWDRQLARKGYSFQQGQWYRIRFDARSEVARSIHCAASQAHQPWSTLGLYEAVEIGPEWKSIALEFQATMDEPIGRIHWDLGGPASIVELADPVVESIDPPPEPAAVEQPPDWELVVAESTSSAGQLDAADGIFRVHVGSQAGGDPWRVQLVRNHLSVMQGQRYRVAFRARASIPRVAYCSVSQAHDPWEGLGLYEEVSLTSDWQNFGFEFSAVSAEPHARLHFDLGGPAATIELAEVQIFPIEAAPHS